MMITAGRKLLGTLLFRDSLTLLTLENEYREATVQSERGVYLNCKQRACILFALKTVSTSLPKALNFTVFYYLLMASTSSVNQCHNPFCYFSYRQVRLLYCKMMPANLW